MLNSTSVVLKGNEDDHNICSETGIFVTHSLRKTCAKTNYSNMLLYNSTTKLFTMWLVFLLCHQQQCLASPGNPVKIPNKSASMKNLIIKDPPPTYECPGMSFRSTCATLDTLFNCTVITGSLAITDVKQSLEACKLRHIEFVNLREITGFLLLAHNRNITSIKNLFPNLTVIRGRKLLRNYALVITSQDDLEKIEFKSLISIQRGHVIVDSNPKLCQTEKINWTRLTQRKGRNNIFLDKEVKCPIKPTCTGCKTESCWSNSVCQKFESDSVISPLQDISKCHEQCLGGCYNNTAEGCVVCKNYTNHGTCVDECPKDLYSCSLHLRCYTRDECVNKKSLLILNNTCIDACPPGYLANSTTYECQPCKRDSKECLRVCGQDRRSEVVYITDIGEAAFYEHCEIINASMVIDVYEPFDTDELKFFLKNIREITGFLKINKSPFLTSLNFFENLEKIHGLRLEDEFFSLVVYDNDRLSELWNVKPGFEISRGGMYIHANDKLCNRRIIEFREKTKHDKSLDSVQRNDQDILCIPANLILRVKSIDHRSIQVRVPSVQLMFEMEIVYKPVRDNEQITENSEIDADVCNRINWRKELKLTEELEWDAETNSHYSYTIRNLEPGTRYAIYVKTFNGDDDSLQSRSEIQYITTPVDYPKPPKLSLKGKTSNTLEIEFSDNEVNSFGRHVADHYNLEVYEMTEDKNSLDTRDYCEEPIINLKELAEEDYDECCSRREAERKDQNFLSQLKKEFSCSLDRKEFCMQNTKNYVSQRLHLSKFFKANQSNFTITGLDNFRLYVVQLQACNRVGCGSFSMLSARTEYSPFADQVDDISFCKVEGTNEYQAEFKEPTKQNGYITSYALHFRNHNFSDENNFYEHYHLVCITRLEHERNNYRFSGNLTDSYNQGALRVYSLGHQTISQWLNITSCSERRMFAALYTSAYIVVTIFVVAICIALYFCYRRGYLHRWFTSARNIIQDRGWFMRPREFLHQDQQNLVRNVEVARFLPHRGPDAAELLELRRRHHEEDGRAVLEPDEDEADEEF